MRHWSQLKCQGNAGASTHRQIDALVDKQTYGVNTKFWSKKLVTYFLAPHPISIERFSLAPRQIVASTLLIDSIYRIYSILERWKKTRLLVFQQMKCVHCCSVCAFPPHVFISHACCASLGEVCFVACCEYTHNRESASEVCKRQVLPDGNCHRCTRFNAQTNNPTKEHFCGGRISFRAICSVG